MIEIKNIEEKTTPAKLRITVKEAFIEDGVLTDDEGSNILSEIKNNLPREDMRLKFTITFELPDKDDDLLDEDEDEDDGNGDIVLD